MQPITVDRPVAASAYKDKKSLLVTSVFHTIQGEGPYAGCPAVFLRLAGCNYGGKGVDGPGCAFCDTEFSFAKGRKYSFDELEPEIRMHANYINQEWEEINDLLVITGGEPMLQDALVGFLAENRFPAAGWDIQIETNGTRLLDFGDAENIYIVWSPKVAETWDGSKFVNAGYAKPADRILRRADCLKILVSANSTSPYYNLPGFHQDFYRVNEGNKPVYLTPINDYLHEPDQLPPNVWTSDYLDRQANLRNHRRAAELAMRWGYKVSTQQHLMLGLE